MLIFALNKNENDMKTFIHADDLGDLRKALAEAADIKANRYKYQELGKNKTLMMIFFNNSLRTRLSTQKAAMNLGMNVIVLDVNAGAWKLETERGVIMDGDKPEHLLEAVPVMGCYCDVIGVRSFARSVSNFQAPWLTSNTMVFIPKFMAAFWVERRVRKLELKKIISRVLCLPNSAN